MSGDSGLATASMRLLDRWWDAEIALLADPEWGTDRRVRVRESCWYAVGLLARDGAGDRARAVEALASVLDHQLDAPGTPWHGTWLRHPDEPVPRSGSQPWRDYDPNWREFIGCALLQVLIEWEPVLPAPVVARIERALDLAVEGSLARGVDPHYSNIALLAAFLQSEVGRRRGDHVMAGRGLALMDAVVDLFETHRAFEEYNAPTYYGIDLYALALWRRYGGGTRAAERACDVEQELWRDIAEHYHAGLRNLVGPYDRAYGMDLRAYLGAIGLWIWEAAGAEVAPVPDLDRPFRHQWDLALAPLVAVLRTPDLPRHVSERLRVFAGPRSLTQAIDGRRVATSVMGDELMVGAEDVAGDRGNLGDQFHPLTVHWRAGAEVAWLRLAGELTIDAVATDVAPDTVEVRLQWPEAGAFAFEVGAERLDADLVSSGRWELAGLTVEMDGAAELDRVETASARRWWLRYGADSEGTAVLTLRWSPQQGGVGGTRGRGR